MKKDIIWPEIGVTVIRIATLTQQQQQQQQPQTRMQQL